eukprot:g4719.t1
MILDVGVFGNRCLTNLCVFFTKNLFNALLHPDCYLIITARKGSGPQPIHGHVSPGFESVKAVFAENFEKRCERGGALCVYFKGEKVIDLWAGERYLGVPWEEDTIVNIYSTTKGLAAL